MPVIILGRLAISTKFQGRGIGTALLRDAVLRVLQGAEKAAIRAILVHAILVHAILVHAILVHAISDKARHFYEKYGFVSLPADPRTLMITVTEVARILGR